MTPRPYQIEGRDFLAARRHALLADEMRVGKTPQAILAAHKVAASSMLVLCPAVAVPHWEREIVRWWPDDGQPAATACVRSYDAARGRDREALLSQRWDVLIADEAHFLKNPEAQRTKLVLGKDGLGWKSQRVWCLSGTPAPRHAGELWPMMRAFGIVGLTYDDFVRRYCYCAPDGRVLGTNTARIPELRELLARFMLRRTRAQVAPDLPAIGFDMLPVKPATELLDMPEGIPDDPAAAARWLEKNASDLAEWRIQVAKAKVPPLVEEIVGELAGGTYSQTLVFGYHTEPLALLNDMLTERGVRSELLTGATSSAKREAIQARFRDGQTQVICANVIAAGTAIDLSAAWHGYFLELSWVPADNLQAANRLVSLDKARPVTYDVVSWDGSFDSKIQAVLTRRVRELNQLY